MKICLTGFTGTGKSTLARRLAAHYGLAYVSGGNVLKKLIGGEEALRDPGWWEREGGKRAMELRKRDPSFDRRVDEELIRLAMEKGDVVLDSWTMAYLLEADDKVAIFLKADLGVRAERVARRDRTSVEEAKEAIIRKDAETKRLYLSLYGFRLGEDLSPFNLVLDTTRLSADETFDVVRRFIDYWFNVRLGREGDLDDKEE
ncbi:MAG: hypothetical protein DRO01_01230 [Thermoproteota archaeon]|nr:MAG: hypothetical protein DRO01_01230 [Candidatus Korarchaeota archaeon]